MEINLYYSSSSSRSKVSRPGLDRGTEWHQCRQYTPPHHCTPPAHTWRTQTCAWHSSSRWGMTGRNSDQSGCCRCQSYRGHTPLQ